MTLKRILVGSTLWICGGTASADLSCPAGTRLQTRDTGPIHHEWCAFADGTRHGASERTNASGTVLESGGWEMGLRDGLWERFSPEGEPIASGHYIRGERQGNWTNLDPETGWSLGRYFERLNPPALPLGVEEGEGWRWWSLELGGAPLGLIPLGESVLVYGQDRVLGLDLGTGEPLFEIPLPGKPREDLVLDGLRVGFVTEDGSITIADLETGSLLQMMPSDPVTGIVAMEEQVVVLRDRTGAVSAVDTAQGRQIWRSKGPWGRVGPVYISGSLVGVQDRYVHSIDPETGARGWRTRLGGRLVELVPGFEGERLFALDRDGGIHALDLGGDLLWSVDGLLQEEVPTGARLRDDRDALLLFSGTELIQIDHDTGGLLHRSKIPEAEVGQVDLLDTLLCSQIANQSLQCADTGGLFSWSLDLRAEPMAPVVLDRLVLAIEEPHRLLAVDRLGARLSGDEDSEQQLFVGDAELLQNPEWAGDDETGGWIGTPFISQWIETEDLGAECESRELFIDMSGPGLRNLQGEDVLILDLELASFDLDTELQVQEPWSHEGLSETWQVDLLADWEPSLIHMELFEASEEFEVHRDAIWRCAIPSLEFRGQVEVQNGAIRRRYDGQIALSVVPDLAPEQGCLLQLRVAEEDLGVWSPPTELGQVWLRLEGLDAPPLAEISALVEGDALLLDAEVEPLLEIWFSEEGEPWRWEKDSIEIDWQDDELWLLAAHEGGEALALTLGELYWPDPEQQGQRIWLFDLLGKMPTPDKRGLISLAELNSCELELSDQ